MPLFFFLSGLFFKFDGDFKNFFFHKSDQLLKPFYVILLSFGVLKILVFQLDLKDGLIGILYGSGNTIPLVSLWFLAHLWITYNVAWIIERTIRFTQQKKEIQIAFITLMLASGYYIISYFGGVSFTISGMSSAVKNAGLPLSIDLSLISTAFFLLGVCFSNFVKSLKLNITALISSIILFTALHNIFDYSLNLNQRQYDSLFWSTIIALSGIYFILNLSALIAFYDGVACRILSYLGEKSLFILIFHGSIQSVSFGVLSQSLSSPVSAILALVFSICFSLLIGAVVSNINVLSIFLLPLKRRPSEARK
jgi:fucose 4-O-acetylase-like acetyltransferase